MKIINGKVGEGVGFQRIRRITGYLVGSLNRFNSAKKAEVGDRKKHGYTQSNQNSIKYDQKTS